MTVCMIILSADALSQNRLCMGSNEILKMNSVCHMYGITKYVLLLYSIKQ